MTCERVTGIVQFQHSFANTDMCNSEIREMKGGCKKTGCSSEEKIACRAQYFTSKFRAGQSGYVDSGVGSQASARAAGPRHNKIEGGDFRTPRPM